jgi:hypothetical protein
MLLFSCQQQKESIPAKAEEEEEAKPNTQPTVSQLKQAKRLVVARQRKSLGPTALLRCATFGHVPPITNKIFKE